jgi:transposase
MGNPRGVRRDFDALEQRRLEAARLLRRGVSQSEVAREVGVHRQSVSRWDKEIKESGVRGLKKAGRAGRKPLLSTADLRRVEDKLKQGAQVRGYETELWTTVRVADLIEQECGVKYHPAHVWRILRELGWSCQRPTSRYRGLAPSPAWRRSLRSGVDRIRRSVWPRGSLPASARGCRQW